MLEDPNDPYQVGTVWNVLHDNFMWPAVILSHNEDGSIELQVISTNNYCTAQRSQLILCESDLSQVEQYILEGMRLCEERIVNISTICEFQFLRTILTSAKITSAVNSLIDKGALISPRRSYFSLPTSERETPTLRKTDISTDWMDEEEVEDGKAPKKSLTAAHSIKPHLSSSTKYTSLESHWRDFCRPGGKHHIIIG